jgi:hypothetical protein
MHELTVHITIKIPESIQPNELRTDLHEAIKDLFVMDGYENSEVIDVEL